MYYHNYLQNRIGPIKIYKSRFVFCSSQTTMCTTKYALVLNNRFVST